MASKKKATLDTPVALDPRQVGGAHLTSASFVFSNNALQLELELVDESGAPIARKRVNAVTAQSQALVASMEAQLLSIGLAAMGMKGKVDG